jgi:mono/diheme cytochrome c family protein
MKRVIQALALFAVLGLGVFWVVTAPAVPTKPRLAAHTPDLENGKLLFNVGGCISCHAPGPNVKDVAADVPAGGKPLKTPIGILYPPNLTPDPETGLGQWTVNDFYLTIHQGVRPDGSNLIPAFPYTSYAKMPSWDVIDLWAYLSSLKPVRNVVPAHQVTGLALVRRGLTFWKKIALNETLWQPDSSQSENWNRGSYLVNGPGHCNECHTPRTFYMALDFSRQFMGGPHPEGKGKVPSLRGLVARQRYKDQADLVSAFQNGETFGYEHMSSGGMGEVQTNLSKLQESDLNAISEYLLSLK